jgi:hypothetical protein
VVCDVNVDARFQVPLRIRSAVERSHGVAERVAVGVWPRIAAGTIAPVRGGVAIRRVRRNDFGPNVERDIPPRACRPAAAREA